MSLIFQKKKKKDSSVELNGTEILRLSVTNSETFEYKHYRKIIEIIDVY